MNAFWAKIFDEMKAVPVTLMFLIGAYAVLGVLEKEYLDLEKDHVSKADLRQIQQNFAALQNQLVDVQETLKYDHADSELHKIETDLFSLKQHVTEEHAKGHVVDRLYEERIDDLTHRHEELMRQMARMDQRVKGP